MTVNAKGQEIDRKPGQAEYFTEDLGNGVTLDMVSIPGGIFRMGSNKAEDEQPIHTVTVAPFYMGKYLVTQAQYETITGRKLSNFKGTECPVEHVSWHDAVEFCRRLSEKLGNLYRLPSEAEWEYACRAGITTPFHFGETITTDLANYRGTDCDYGGTTYPGGYGQGPRGQYRESTTPVGNFPSNHFGLFDMHGNVWEWCQDTWHKNYQDAPSDGSAWINDNDNRLLRGGAWISPPRSCRSAYRSYTSPENRDLNIGFRVVCSAPRAS